MKLTKEAKLRAKIIKKLSYKELLFFHSFLELHDRRIKRFWK